MLNKPLQKISCELIQGKTLLKQRLFLHCGDCVIQLESNSASLLNKLQQYFSHIVINQTTADIKIIAVESVPLTLPYPFKDWPREAGKSGRKDAYYQLDKARLIRKVRTGMIFLQSETYKIASGPCLKHPNQVINFINSQHMNWLQQRSWLICHAAAIAYNNRAIAIAGFSGGGKSTFMLQLLDNDKIDFISNDRLFIRQSGNKVDITGIAKLPRINPGTIVHNPRLHALIPEEQRAQLLQLPRQKLWDMEEKYDVDIEQVYGDGRIVDNKPLQAFIILNWRHDDNQTFQVNKIDLAQRHDLLAAIMKSPGPFYQDQSGQCLAENAVSPKSEYIRLLAQVTVYEVSGKVDFSALQTYFYQHIIREAR